MCTKTTYRSIEGIMQRLSCEPTGFVEWPSSQNVSVGSTVSFHCQHLTGDVAWRMNNLSSQNFPSASTISESGLHTLTITEPSPEFNGTEIRCIAHLNGNSELTMPATLLLQGCVHLHRLVICTCTSFCSHHRSISCCE